MSADRGKQIQQGAKCCEVVLMLARDRVAVGSFPMDEEKRSNILANFDDAVAANQALGSALLNAGVMNTPPSAPELTKARCESAVRRLEEALAAQPDLIKHILAARGIA